MATVRDLIKGSLRLIGAIDPGESIEAQEATDALQTLNDLIESLSNQKLMIYQSVREEFTLTSGDGEYSLGASGDFNTTRPIKVEQACIEVQDAEPYEIALEILNPQEWAGITTKGLTSENPSKVFFANTYPTDTVYLYPVPTATNKLVLYSWKPLSSFANVSADVSLPQGYFRMLKYNLAVELAPEYGKEASATVYKIAEDTKNQIKIVNTKMLYIGSDIETNKRFNILAGE